MDELSPPSLLPPLPPLPRTVRVAPSDDVEAVTSWVTAAGIGDGHPVVPPTDARVEAMLAGWPRHEHLGELAPLRRDVTVEDVAVCAVLAGCPPSAMTALVAAVRAVQHEKFNLLGITTTTGSAAIGVVLHGNVVRQVGANAGANYLGPGNVANATIGRALATLVRVVGGALPGSIDVAIAGQPAKYGLCFAELPGQPGWPGLHQERGYDGGAGAVTVLGVSGTVELVDASSQDVVDLLDTLAAALLLPVASASDGTTLGNGEPLVVLPPEWVTRLRDAGWSKQQVRQHLWEKAQVPLDRLAYGLAARASTRAREAGLLRVAESPRDIMLLVAGGPGTKATLMPLWSGSRSVTVRVGAQPHHI
jgi:hypothetical protein